LGTTFLIKAHTTPFWGQSFPPNFPRWTGPFFLSFLVSLLFWFGLSGLMGLGFFSTSDNINVSIMGYYMIMGLGFFSTSDNINVSIMGYYIIMGLGFFSTSDNINICIMGYYMTLGLGFFCNLIY
jgi:hypothetical protein